MSGMTLVQREDAHHKTTITVVLHGCTFGVINLNMYKEL